MAEKPARKLSFELNSEQLKALKPLIEAAGKIDVAGTIEGGKLNVSFIVCNAAFKVEGIKSEK